jgi:hypothetical protein
MIILLLVLLMQTIKRNKEHYQPNNHIVCIYAYYEKDENYKKNLEYFLQKGILDNVDYYFVINGSSTIDFSSIGNRKNITILHRENKGYDFGAYSYVIPLLEKKYDYYFFMNTSVSGPYIRDKSRKWTDFFIELFTDSDIRIVGTTINILNANGVDLPSSHVQSMFFCIDREYLDYLKEIDFFNEEKINKMNFVELVYDKEVNLSQEAIKKGWNINCILPEYKNLDYRTLKHDINPFSAGGDVCFENAYFGKTLDKYDVIFIKTNRIKINDD